MHVIYRITYLPHKDTDDLPIYYIGSKYNYKGNYYGSVSSNKIFNFTDGKKLKSWWKEMTLQEPDMFEFEILKKFDYITPTELVVEEKKIHEQLDVANSVKYFNMSIATLGWVSCPKDDDTRKKISDSLKKYWSSNTAVVQNRKQELVEQNKKNSSARMRKKWNDNEFKKKMSKRTPRSMSDLQKDEISKRQKDRWQQMKKNGITSLKPTRAIRVNNKTFSRASEAADFFNKSISWVRKYGKYIDE